MSLAETCREVASRHPYMIDGLRDDIINYRALARRIKPEVEEIEQREVDIEAVTTALRRYAEKLQQGDNLHEHISEVLSNSRVSLRGNVVSLTAEEIESIPYMDGFFHLVRGRNYTTIVVDEANIDEVKDEVDVEIVEEKTDLTCITVESPEEIAEVPGVLSRMVSRFMSEGINIVDITSCYTETIIVVKRRDSVKALETLEEVIEASGKQPTTP